MCVDKSKKRYPLLFCNCGVEVTGHRSSESVSICLHNERWPEENQGNFTLCRHRKQIHSIGWDIMQL